MLTINPEAKLLVAQHIVQYSTSVISGLELRLLTRSNGITQQVSFDNMKISVTRFHVAQG